MSFKSRIKRLISGFPGETSYWNERYKKGGNSGSGSYGELAVYKASVINSFIKEYSITSIIDFGCGDGNQSSLLSLEGINYHGLDISEEALSLSKKKFQNRNQCQFTLYQDFLKNPEKGELTISLDVLYHIVSDKGYYEYLHVLFNSSNKYVIIYSREDVEENKNHVFDRAFLKDIKESFPKWSLKRKEENPYAYDSKDPEHSSRSNFYFFEIEEIANE